MKAKKIALWSLLIGNLLIGAVALFLWFSGAFSWGFESNHKKKPSNKAVSITAQTFAKQFAFEYCTWSMKEEEERAERLQPFLAKGLDEQAGVQFSSLKTNAQATLADVWKVESVGSNQSTITVLVNVALIPPHAPDDVKIVKRWLSIPIRAITKEQFIVQEIPNLMPEPPIAQVKKPVKNIQGQKVIDPTKQQIERALKNFFTIYCQGNAEQIRYVSRAKKPIQGYRGSMKFQSITQIQIVRNKHDYIAYGSVRLQETETKVEVEYPFQIRLRKEKGQWFVHDLKH